MWVVQVNNFIVGWILLLQFILKGFQTFVEQSVVKGLPDCGIHLGKFVQTVHHGIHIKATATYHDNYIMLLEQLLQKMDGIPFKIPHGIGFKNALVLDKMMEYFVQFFWRGDSGSYVHFLEKL